MGSRMRKIAWCALFVYISFTCFADEGNVPLWRTGLKKAFPDSEFISIIGEANTIEGAKNNALAEIAYYFRTSVSSVRDVNYRSLQLTNDDKINSSESREIVTSTSVSTDMELATVQTTEVYFDKASKMYSCAAYMNRDTAWTFYETRVNSAYENFNGFYKRYVAEKDTFSRIKLLGSAIVAGKEFIDALSFAEIISEEKAAKKYGESKNTVATLKSLHEAEKDKVVVFVSVNDEPGSVIYAAVSKIFADEGLTVADAKDKASYDVSVAIDYNASQDGSTIVMTPGIRVTVAKGKSVLYSFADKSDRVVAFTERRAKNQVINAMTKIVEDGLQANFHAAINGLAD